MRLEREDGLPRIVIRRFADGTEHEIAFDEEAYSLGIRRLRIRHEHAALRLFVDDDAGAGLRLRHGDARAHLAQDAGSAERPQSGQLRHAPADGAGARRRDGAGLAALPQGNAARRLGAASALRLRRLRHRHPGVLHHQRASLVDRGFIYAIAHVRGGKDKGYRWYKDGKREKKVNTFTDFIAAGDYLARQGFTARGRIVAQGGSAGGMLMGAVANMAPDLFLGIIADVPFVDVLTTMLDASLPLTPPEWPEWGNPIESAEAYRTIAAYSPYDNVEAQAYPQILALAGLTDPRVTYWEPAKWVAQLRELKTGDNLVLLKTNMDAGHGGASGRFERLKEMALAYAFALKIAGLGGPT